MTILLEEFRLETYKERELLMIALTYYESHRAEELKYMPEHREAMDALTTRLSRTQCQPGGCSYCGGPSDDY